LFRYLDVDPDLANYDLARGKLGLPARHHATFDGLVAGLGWAVDVDRDAVMDGFAAGPAHWLLPLTLRRYGCACCWSGLIAEGRPLYIRKDWIWSASWWCHEHQLPLSVMPAWDWPRREGSLAAMLGRLEAAAREIVRAARPTARLIAYNRAVIEFLRKGDDGVTPQRYRRYVETIVANRFHFSSERIRLLALRHSSGAQPARRFERFVALSRSELAKEEGFFRRPQPRVEESISRRLSTGPGAAAAGNPICRCCCKPICPLPSARKRGRAARSPRGAWRQLWLLSLDEQRIGAKMDE
jgi:hypothetical protein